MMSDLFGPAPLMVLPAHIAKPQPKMLDLPDEDMEVVRQALDPTRVSFGMNRSALRIADQVTRLSVDKLSERQRNAIIRIAYRFRRQMPGYVQDLLKPFAATFFRFRR